METPPAPAHNDDSSDLLTESSDMLATAAAAAAAAVSPPLSLSSSVDDYPVGIDGIHLALLFPFHIILDRRLEVVQFGPSIGKIIPSLTRHQPFRKYFSVVYPPVQDAGWTFDSTRKW